MNVIITRPLEDSILLINNLKKKGYNPIHLPVIEVEKIETDNIDLKNYVGLIFTSSNAIKFLNVKNLDKKIKCYCVGIKTELTAKEFGFLNTISAGGTVDSLKEIIIRSQNISDGKLLYICSEFISKDLDLELKKEGYKIDRINNYTSKPVQNINKNILKNLDKRLPTIFLVYSIKSAINLVDLLRKNSLLNIVTQSNLMCISNEVSLLLNNLKWKKITIFNPGEEEFFLKKVFSNGSN